MSRKLIALLTSIFILSVTETSLGCSIEGNIKIGSKHYFIAETELSWFHAEEECKSIGGHLAHLLNQKEMDQVEQHLTLRFGYWLDVNDLKTEGEYVSSTTGDKAFTSFRTEQPDNNENEDCVEMEKANRMNDLNCNNRLRYICEFDSCENQIHNAKLESQKIEKPSNNNKTAYVAASVVGCVITVLALAVYYLKMSQVVVFN